MAEVAAADVMPGMSPLPKMEGRQGQHSADGADDVIRTPISKEGMMTTIVLNDKDSHQEARRG